MKVAFYDIESIADEKITFVVIVSRYEGKWILVRHQERVTLEVPGGHREPQKRQLTVNYLKKPGL